MLIHSHRLILIVYSTQSGSTRYCRQHNHNRILHWSYDNATLRPLYRWPIGYRNRLPNLELPTSRTWKQCCSLEFRQFNSIKYLFFRLSILLVLQQYLLQPHWWRFHEGFHLRSRIWFRVVLRNQSKVNFSALYSITQTPRFRLVFGIVHSWDSLPAIYMVALYS